MILNVFFMVEKAEMNNYMALVHDHVAFQW